MQPFRAGGRNTREDDMKADNTDKLIDRAIAGLPYRRPSAGFRARVMAEIAAQAPAEAGFGWVMKAFGLIEAAWAGALVLLSAGFVYRVLSENADLFAQPGGTVQFLKLMAARGAMLTAKLYAGLSLVSDLAYAVLNLLPPLYEIAAAALVAAGIIKAVSGGRLAAQRI